MSAARDAVLAALRSGRRPPHPRVHYVPPAILDAVARFAAKAKASYAEFQHVPAMEDVPEAVLAILSRRGGDFRIHLPTNSLLQALPWHRVPQITRDDASPLAESVALSAADFGIAETGTLAFLSGAARPSSWHFLPGLEIALLRRECLFGTVEEMFANFPAARWPSTLNLVTGPSRTGDIEQTMERGAHGPREIQILMIGKSL